MSSQEQLTAYLATLATLIIVFVAALVTAALSPDVVGKMEVFGLGTVLGGLIGVLRIPSLRSPIATTEGDDVNVDNTK